METKEVMLYTITIISILAFVYLIFGTLTKIPVTSDKKFISMTGNAVLDLEDNFQVGDILTGNIIINSNELDKYGLLLLSQDGKPIVTKTFNLNEILRNDSDSSRQSSIKIEDLIQYKFNETGKYELLFSVLDLNINVKKEIVVG